jgi:hypothetical protein
MSEEMQQDAVDCATQALEKYNIEKVIILLWFIVNVLERNLDSNFGGCEILAVLKNLPS